MTSGITTYTTSTRAMLYGARWPSATLKLHYDIDDPAAVRLELPTLRASWHLSRERLAEGLDTRLLDPCDPGTETASAVFLASVPIAERTFIGLRGASTRYALSVLTAHLREFLAATYHICSCWTEQQLLDTELAAQLDLFTMTQGGA